MKPVCDIDWHYNIPDITNVYKTFFELVFLPESRDEMNFAVLCCTFLNFRETIPVLKLHDGNVTVIEPLHYSGSPTDDEPTGTGEGAYNPGAQDTFTVLKKMVQSDPNISSQFKSAMGL